MLIVCSTFFAAASEGAPEDEQVERPSEASSSQVESTALAERESTSHPNLRFVRRGDPAKPPVDEEVLRAGFVDEGEAATIPAQLSVAPRDEVDEQVAPDEGHETPERLLIPFTASRFAQEDAPPPVVGPDDVNVEGTPFEILDRSEDLTVIMRRSRLLQSRLGIFRTAIADPRICEVVQYSPQEVSIIGKSQGATHVTFWFEDREQEPVTFLVNVVPDPEVQERREEEYQILQDVINELFPDSKVKLTPIANKLLVTGEAKGAEEAAQILSIIRGQGIYGQNGAFPYGTLVGGAAANPFPDPDAPNSLPASLVVNMLRIPGVQQVALRVKIAELNRTKARSFGVDLDLGFDDGRLVVQSFLNAATGGTASILGMFDNDELNFGIHYLETKGVVRVLSEPTLVTLSGRAASFVAGGEFAVPTVVGVGGAAAVTTDFRAFGAIISFLPVVIDKDSIRLQVSPEFSQVNNDLTVNDTPGLNTRAVTTTVEMREGQTLAIAGLLDDSVAGNIAGNVPIIWRILGRRTMTHNETELIILVTPELVHAMDPEEVPPLPGFDVTEPTNDQFFLRGWLEGDPNLNYRSTVWPSLRRRYRAGASSMMSGPFGHGQ